MSSPPVSPGRTGWVWLLFSVAAALAIGYVLAGTWLRSELHLRRAAAAERADDLESADRHLRSALRAAPDRPDARLLAARLGWRRRLGGPQPEAGWDEPLRRHIRAAESDPRLLDRAVFETHLLNAQTGQWAAAESHLRRRAAADGPDAVPALEALTGGAILEQRLLPALEASGRLVDRNPGSAVAHFWRGLVRELAQGAAGRSDADYRRAVDLAPDRREFRLRLAVALSLSADTRAEARGLFERLAAESPDDPAAVYGLGRCLLDLGEPAAAVAPLRRAAELTPADGGALAAFGRAVLEAGDPAAAEPVLRRGVAMAPYDRKANFALGTCLAQLGRGDAARPYLDAADRLYATNLRMLELSKEVFADPAAGPAKRCELGELLADLGYRELGRYWVESALAVEAGYAPARKALERLAAGPKP